MWWRRRVYGVCLRVSEDFHNESVASTPNTSGHRMSSVLVPMVRRTASSVNSMRPSSARNSLSSLTSWVIPDTVVLQSYLRTLFYFPAPYPTSLARTPSDVGEPAVNPQSPGQDGPVV